MSYPTKEKMLQQQREIADYARMLEKREAFLIEALTSLAKGLGRKIGDDGKWSAANLAADKLSELAVMPRPQKPYISGVIT